MNENRDHDQLFKTLIREFFADFLRLFFAEWATRFDLQHVEWLDQEVFRDPPDGSRHLLDLVAKLHTKLPVGVQDLETPDTWLALIHFEIESADRTTRIKPRLPAYYIHLRERSGLPVLPIVIYLKVGLDGIGVDVVNETFLEFEVLTFRYLYVGLPGLDAIEYLKGDNWLGVALAALMKFDKREANQLGSEALKRIQMAPLTEQQRYLLAACVDRYLPLDETGRREFEAAINADEGVRDMTKGMFQRAFEEGTQKGLEEGRNKGLKEGLEEGRNIGAKEGSFRLIRAQLEQKFGSLSDRFLEKLNSLPAERLVTVGINAMTAKSLEDLGIE